MTRFSSSPKKAAPQRRSCRLGLEPLEDRCLLSAGFIQVNLASDVPGLARVTDPNLVNPWGVAFSPTGPFWFANNGSGSSDLLDGSGQPVPLVNGVTSASAGGSPTGTVFNGGDGFAIWQNGLAAPSRFLFASEDGTISGWSEVVDPNQAVQVVDNSSLGAVYTGLALGTDAAGHAFLYAADFGRGTIDVFDQQFQPVLRPGSFQDATLPAGYVPYNIQSIGGLLYVTYAQQSNNRRDDVPGAGHGFIDVYRTDGSLASRFASGGALNSPWGVALAPADYGAFGGDLLVGNEGDGHISAYDPRSGAFLGQLTDDAGKAIAIPNLWSLTFGNGHEGGDASTLFFAAGVNYDEHGLFGALQAPDRYGAGTAGMGTYDPSAPGEPDDYPLPPRNGPAFVLSNDAVLPPGAELLPMRESSLVLIPTLSSFAPTSTKVDAPMPAGAVVGLTANASVLPGTPASRGFADDAVALRSFLDLNAATNVPAKKSEGQGANTTLRADARPASVPVGETEAVALAAAFVEKSEAVQTAVAAEKQIEASDESQGLYQTDAAENGGRWKKLATLALVVGVPWIWAYWQTRRMAPEPRGAARERW
jgi:uncharacterized protein (TIGR03118 family)